MVMFDQDAGTAGLQCCGLGEWRPVNSILRGLYRWGSCDTGIGTCQER
jgi:hypothetical protein